MHCPEELEVTVEAPAGFNLKSSDPGPGPGGADVPVTVYYTIDGYVQPVGAACWKCPHPTSTASDTAMLPMLIPCKIKHKIPHPWYKSYRKCGFLHLTFVIVIDFGRRYYQRAPKVILLKFSATITAVCTLRVAPRDPTLDSASLSAT
eukprot:802753-Rhodomonas_salina.6